MSEIPTLPSLYELVTLDRADSALEEAKRLAANGAPEGTLVWVREQTDARTRSGKRWLSPPGNLYCAIIIRPDFDNHTAQQLGPLTVVSAGHALAGLVSPMTGLRFRWPTRIMLNDLIAGTVQMAASAQVKEPLDWLVVSLYVNVAEHPLNPEPERYSSVLACGAEDVSSVDLLEAFSRQFLRWINRWAEEGMTPVMKAWLQRADGIGDAQSFLCDNEVVRGTLLEVDEHTGAAVLASPSGAQSRLSYARYFALYPSDTQRQAGVYLSHLVGGDVLVHAFTDDDYALADIVEFFRLGSYDKEKGLRLTHAESGQLKAMADAQSFDHAEGFIQMCLDIHKAALGQSEEVLTLIEVE